ncbi:MAG: response regulator [Lachnospiraceae bacterium]|nr:response regulator [Lachnospiraceae bacterium]
MYSILIVDDEHFMRNGIARVLPWEKLQIDRVDTAESGTKALRKMELHMPDIVITDIEMDQMDGLSLIRRMNQLNPKLRIIVLTGHDDFDYVRECCRMEVQDYLLKPVEAEKLSEAVGAQVKALERYAREEAQKRTMDRVNGLAQQMKVERIFRTFLKTGSGQEEVRKILKDYGFKEGDRFQAAVISPECAVKNEWSGNFELLHLSIKSVCIEHIEYRHDGITFQDEGGAFVLLLFRSKAHPDSRELLKQLGTILQNEYDVIQKVSLGREVDRIREIPESYQDALGQCYDESRKGPAHSMFQNYQQEIIRSLGDTEWVLRLFESYWKELSVSRMSPALMQKDCFHLLSDIYYDWLQETGNTANQILTELLIRLQSSDECGIYEAGRAFLEQLLSESPKKDDDVIGNVKRYIDSHLNQPLSVSQLAGQFYLSVAYFSKLFKKTTGVGCNYYIVCQRMERAKKLLKSGSVKVGEVSEKVGYKDVNYFSLTFKKYTGYSPAEYREKNISR